MNEVLKVREGTRRYLYLRVPKAEKVRLGTRPFRGVPHVPAVPEKGDVRPTALPPFPDKAEEEHP